MERVLGRLSRKESLAGREGGQGLPRTLHPSETAGGEPEEAGLARVKSRQREVGAQDRGQCCMQRDVMWDHLGDSEDC